MIQFVCCGCGAQLRIGDEWSGKLGRCPHCRTNTRLPGTIKRSSRLVILTRMVAWPVVVLSFWTFFLGWPIFVGGAVALALALGFWWASTNVFAFLWHPTYYRLWKGGKGGDPWFDTLPPMFNPDPPHVRLQELYREKLRQECEEVDRQFGIAPASASDMPKGIDDPDVI